MTTMLPRDFRSVIDAKHYCYFVEGKKSYQQALVDAAKEWSKVKKDLVPGFYRSVSGFNDVVCGIVGDDRQHKIDVTIAKARVKAFLTSGEPRSPYHWAGCPAPDSSCYQ